MKIVNKTIQPDRKLQRTRTKSGQILNDKQAYKYTDHSWLNKCICIYKPLIASSNYNRFLSPPIIRIFMSVHLTV